MVTKGEAWQPPVKPLSWALMLLLSGWVALADDFPTAASGSCRTRQ